MVGVFWVLFGWVMSVVIAFILGAVYAHRGDPSEVGSSRAPGCHRASTTARRR